MPNETRVFGSVHVSIRPNEKYRAVINAELPSDATYDTEAEYRDAHPAPDAADAYVEVVDSAESVEQYVDDPNDLPTLSWDEISPASDPDLLAKIATYFDGLSPDEPADLLRAKCRLLDVDVYTDAQIAAQAELREQ